MPRIPSTHICQEDADEPHDKLQSAIFWIHLLEYQPVKCKGIAVDNLIFAIKMGRKSFQMSQSHCTMLLVSSY